MMHNGVQSFNAFQFKFLSKLFPNSPSIYRLKSSFKKSQVKSEKKLENVGDDNDSMHKPFHGRQHIIMKSNTA